MAADFPARVGIAVARAAEIYSLGQWSTGVAWSTIKVPLAIAALRNDRWGANDLVVRAITKSDNGAAEKLWAGLGEPAQAARRVQAIIEESLDAATVVESQRVRPGFTAFGQTQWPLDQQARFALQLPGIAEADTVIELLCRLTAKQCWGLAARGIPAKGGWGPGSTARTYLVRQFGLAATESGNVGVALAVEARTFKAGIDVINQLTDWLVDNLPELSEQ
ncbi:hypothetical protein A5791_18760 [Mycobacterium sp. 852002-51163_SCH5372311]|uniref:hypothetical protein n=1 Tax=Mycobacterium sp. 852002-51163_SCH5372311 TaxID=1834097 RepID=UPI0007FF9B39|nr:hypothetical protein [Mycobacterium sp. 852002-51163_SCH5372311]OBF88050.1 hypothetical protein A5791_18760 [Mycobacterium sp. 852002-51163_SCH5372311]